MMDIDTPLSAYISFHGKRKSELEKGKIFSVRDLLYHLPVKVQKGEQYISGITNTPVTLEGVIKKISMRRTRGKKRVMMSEGVLDTGKGTIRLVWLNQPYMVKKFPEGSVVQVKGKTSGGTSLYIANSYITLVDSIKKDISVEKYIPETLHTIYRSIGIIDSLWFCSALQKILQQGSVENIVPQEIRDTYNLPTRDTALRHLHTPRTESEYEVARKYIAFEYIFLLKLKNALSRTERKRMKAYPVSPKHAIATYANQFSYTLTSAQKKVFKDIVKDMKNNVPMTRLLEGDVGSGKTAVAAMALEVVVTAPHPAEKARFLQAAYMAPTELLARQQFELLCEMFKEKNISCGLVTGSKCEVFPSRVDKNLPVSVSKKQMQKWMEEGVVRIVVGTHALIQKNVIFRDCALVIIDEQHRFGVAQRYSFMEKTPVSPHMLSMTATPIPRTLALTLYGDLDISIIDELPKGRKYAHTKIIYPGKEQEAYDIVSQEIEKGRQVYIVCPRIEQSEKSDMVAVATEIDTMKKMFPSMTIEGMHGKMKKTEQQEYLARFVEGDIDILVATTVVEVGVNVLNATCMIVQDADRFGLAQLHQLRGRVTRSSHQPYCFAFTKSRSVTTLERLQHFEENSDGFDLAEKDLEIRGAGELSGVRQSGISDLAMESLKNIKLVEAAQKSVEIIMKNGIETYPTLEKEIQRAIRLGD